MRTREFDNGVKESAFAEIEAVRFQEAPCSASARARKWWSNTVSSQRSQGESSFGPVTLDEPVIAVPPGPASTPPGEGYLMPSGGNTTFQPGSAPAVPGKSAHEGAPQFTEAAAIPQGGSATRSGWSLLPLKQMLPRVHVGHVTCTSLQTAHACAYFNVAWLTQVSRQRRTSFLEQMF